MIAAEGGQDAGMDRYKRVALHHAHLPKLDRAGPIEYDPRSGTTRYRGHPLVAGGPAMLGEFGTD